MPKTSKKLSPSNPKSKTPESPPANEFSSKVRRITKRKVPPEWVADLNRLRGFITRTREINGPRVDTFSDSSGKKRKFTIATISTDLHVGQLNELKTHDYRIWTLKQDQKERLQREFLNYLKQAGDAGADLVCFNELAYPAAIEDVAFKNKVAKLISKYGFALIAGTYHDSRRHYNMCPIFAIKGESPKVLAHAKMTSAIRAYEVIRIPPNRNIRYYETAIGCFAVLICIDVFDPSLVFRLILQNHQSSGEQKIHFVFVPSFTVTGASELASACQDLSYASGSVVVYVNCGADTPRHAVYFCGEEVMAGNSRIKSKVRKLSKNLQIFTTNFEEYQRMRNKVNDNYSSVFQYLIAVKDGIKIDIKA